MNKALRTLSTVLIVALLAAIMLLGAGCSADEEEPVTPPTEEPTEEPAAEEPSAGEELLAGACASCHDVTRIYLQNEMTQWADVINKMESAHGAVLTDQEKADVAAFLESRQQSVGEQLVRGKCTTCHDLDRVTALEDADWDAVVTSMVEAHGAVLTAQEQADVVAYLNSLK
jgi:cytochrome c5